VGIAQPQVTIVQFVDVMRKELAFMQVGVTAAVVGVAFAAKDGCPKFGSQIRLDSIGNIGTVERRTVLREGNLPGRKMIIDCLRPIGERRPCNWSGTVVARRNGQGQYDGEPQIRPHEAVGQCGEGERVCLGHKMGPVEIKYQMR
jgi:hypothetical protein